MVKSAFANKNRRQRYRKKIIYANDCVKLCKKKFYACTPSSFLKPSTLFFMWKCGSVEVKKPPRLHDEVALKT